MEERQIKQAVILAGGYGERMKPFTEQHPKPMYPFQKTPFIDYLINRLRDLELRKYYCFWDIWRIRYKIF